MRSFFLSLCVVGASIVAASSVACTAPTEPEQKPVETIEVNDQRLEDLQASPIHVDLAKEHARYLIDVSVDKRDKVSIDIGVSHIPYSKYLLDLEKKGVKLFDGEALEITTDPSAMLSKATIEQNDACKAGLLVCAKKADSGDRCYCVSR